MSKPEVTIYTDGAAKGNPGPGGYGVLMISGNHKKEISEGFELTTNNRMELLAVIIGLEALKTPCMVTVYSDSKYVVDAIEKKWVFAWLKKDFKGKKNQDLWRRFLKIYPKHNIKLIWVKGHANNLGNERCDKLAVEAATGKVLKIDIGYIASIQSDNVLF